MSIKYLAIIVLLVFTSTKIVNYENGKNSLPYLFGLSYRIFESSNSLMNESPEILDFYTGRDNKPHYTYANNKNWNSINFQ